MLHVPAAHVRIRGYALDAVPQQRVGSIHEHGLRFENAVGDDRFRHVELQLSGLSG